MQKRVVSICKFPVFTGSFKKIGKLKNPAISSDGGIFLAIVSLYSATKNQ